jgi:hypothetical protein
MRLLRPRLLADSQALRYVFFRYGEAGGLAYVCVEVSNSCSYLIDSIAFRREQVADMHLACMSELHNKHYPLVETR